MAVSPTNTSAKKRNGRKSYNSGSPVDPWLERKVRAIQILQVPAPAKIPWLIHGFSTRQGGVSLLEGEKVLNPGFTAWDSRDTVLENHPRSQPSLGAAALPPISLPPIHPH